MLRAALTDAPSPSPLPTRRVRARLVFGALLWLPNEIEHRLTGISPEITTTNEAGPGVGAKRWAALVLDIPARAFCSAGGCSTNLSPGLASLTDTSVSLGCRPALGARLMLGLGGQLTDDEPGSPGQNNSRLFCCKCATGE